MQINSMNITLDSNPSDAPGCVKLIADDGRDMLVQLDYDWPAIAATFGWSTRHVQNPDDPDADCLHDQTDGTVNCPKCGVTVSQFIADARQYLDDNDGSETEDPGYFDN